MKNVPYKRVDRMNDQIRQIVSATLLEFVHEDSLAGVSVTAADISPDFKHAKLFYRVLPGFDADKARLSLIKVLPKVQRIVAKEMQTRYSPNIRFIFDNSLDEGSKIEALLEKIKEDV
ncbi:MAG TPA: 30S ribosome-binding factor RbfA [Oligoflexia bacterium]|nr:30S ribosome-binding factor RbfA [Oligoflexia bacterium]HMR25130.1 30S ribosome-binding factor RbfA [Oligoflexia bacterium]